MLLMILIYTIDQVTTTYSGQVSVKFLYIAFRNEIKPQNLNYVHQPTIL
jgi:hypothetical protein